MLGLDDVSEGDEAQSTMIGHVSDAIARRWGVPVDGGERLIWQAADAGIDRAVPGGGVGGRRGRRGSDQMVVRVHDDLNMVRVEALVGDGQGRRLQDRWDVVLSGDVRRNGARGWGWYRVLLHVPLEDEGRRRRGQGGRGRAIVAVRCGDGMLVRVASGRWDRGRTDRPRPRHLARRRAGALAIYHGDIVASPTQTEESALARLCGPLHRIFFGLDRARGPGRLLVCGGLWRQQRHGGAYRCRRRLDESAIVGSRDSWCHLDRSALGNLADIGASRGKA